MNAFIRESTFKSGEMYNDLDDIMEKLTNKEDGPLNYNGIDLDDDTISLLSDAIGLGLRQIKIRNKEKYTPKKYKK